MPSSVNAAGIGLPRSAVPNTASHPTETGTLSAAAKTKLSSPMNTPSVMKIKRSVLVVAPIEQLVTATSAQILGKTG